MNREIALLSIAVVAVAGVAAIPFATAIEDQTNDVLKVLDKVTRGTVDTLDRGWEIALKFKDPTYHYDPSELGDPPPALSDALANVTITEQTLPPSNSTG